MKAAAMMMMMRAVSPLLRSPQRRQLLIRHTRPPNKGPHAPIGTPIRMHVASASSGSHSGAGGGGQAVRRRDAWDDDTHARKWTTQGGPTRSNPERKRQLRLLSRMIAGRYSRGDVMLALGCGSGLCSRAVLDGIDGVDDASSSRQEEEKTETGTAIVGIDASAAMMKMARGIAGERLATFKTGFKTLRDLDSAHELLQFAFDPIGDYDALAQKLRDPSPFAIGFSVQVLHEVPANEKLDALAFAYRSLRPGAPFYILDRFLFEPSSPFVNEYQAMFVESREHRLALASMEGGNEDIMEWDAYVHKYLNVKLDDASTEEEYVALLYDAGFASVEVPYRYFNRSLIVAWKAE